jgi:hypothetical protein
MVGEGRGVGVLVAVGGRGSGGVRNPHPAAINKEPRLNKVMMARIRVVLDKKWCFIRALL